jgi:hypothetical protein
MLLAADRSAATPLIVRSFNSPPGASATGVAGLAFNSLTQELYVQENAAIYVTNRYGNLLRTLTAPRSNFWDIDVAPEAFSLGGTPILQGTLIGGRQSGGDTFVAFHPLTGTQLAFLGTGSSSSFSVAYDRNSGEMMSHSLFGADSIQRYNAVTGALNGQTITAETEFGDIEFIDATGGFVSSRTGSPPGLLVEFNSADAFVANHDLTAIGVPVPTAGYHGILGLAYDEARNTLFVLNGNGVIYEIGDLFGPSVPEPSTLALLLIAAAPFLRHPHAARRRTA